MKRVIMFRGLDHKGNWQYGTYYYGCMYPTSFNGHYINDTLVDPSTICQFTGLHDKNGVEIYEGDVNHDGGTVIFNQDDASFVWDYPDIEMIAMEDEHKWCTITGNIHQTTTP